MSFTKPDDDECGVYVCPCCGRWCFAYGPELNYDYRRDYNPFYILHIHSCPYCDFIDVVFRKF